MTVNVGDINDNPPRFSKSIYFGSVEENARFGTTIVQVTATDPDLGQTTIFYSLQMSIPSQRRCFRISGNGVITLSCRLDFSKTRFYSLTVKARDSQLESSAGVRINVTDSNTHKPISNNVFTDKGLARLPQLMEGFLLSRQLMVTKD